MHTCSDSINSELTAIWNSQLYDGGITGYLNIFMPESIKLIAINPLGQPMYAFSSDGNTFQAINAVKGVYKHGKLQRFIERHSLPKGLLQGEWAAWLAGRILFTEDQVVDIFQDHLDRGVWILIEKMNGKLRKKEYVLFDPLKKIIAERAVISEEGDELARIIYSSWQVIDGCRIPVEIVIDGTSFGTDITIELSEIITDAQFTKDTFYLKLPPGYLQQYYP